MMKFRQLALLGGLALVVWPAALLAQYPSETVGFNQAPLDDPDTSKEMFQIPEHSGSTRDYVVANSPDLYDWNGAFRAVGLQSEGAAALEAYFTWVDPADPDAWVRLTTAEGDLRPNPSLDTRGKVRFKLVNRSQLSAGTIGLCLGIRETGDDVPQMENGGVAGDIEWVGVDTTPNGIIAGANGLVDTEAVGDDVQEYPLGYDIVANGLPTGTAVISPGPDGNLDTTPTPDDEVRFGYFISATDGRVPIPAITLAPQPFPYVLEWDLATGTVTVDGTPYTAGIAPLTGNGVLDPASDRGTLEHLAITNLASDVALNIDFGIDELQFEATVMDPAMPPAVASPIVAGQETITVTGLQYTVDQVQLYVNGGLLETKSATWPDDVEFTIAGAVPGDVYTAKQREGDSQLWSEESLPVTVLAAAPPYTFSILVDNGGTGACDYTTGGWEWVGVTSTTSTWIPHGTLIAQDSKQWQAIDIPLDDDAVVIAHYGGNGELGPSPTGNYTIDSFWWTIADSVSPDNLDHEVFIDRIEMLDGGGAVTGILHDMESGINYLSRTRDQSSTTPAASELSQTSSYDGSTGHRVAWTYDTADPGETVGLYHNIGFACGTSPLIPDTTATLRFHMYCREQATNPTVAVPEVIAPIIVGDQDTIRILNDGSATAIQLYINGQPEGDPVLPSGPETDFAGLTLTPGASITATQTLGASGTSDPAYARVVSDAPTRPSVVGPLLPDDGTVTVTGVTYVPFAEASEVTVLVNDSPNGTAVPTGDSVEVTLDTPLADGQEVTAVQVVNTVTSDPSDPITVGFPVPVFYAAPAEGDASITIMGLYPGATDVTVATTDGLKEFSVVVPPDVDRVDVPVSGLVVDDVLWANQSVGALTSGWSDTETVTVNVSTDVLACDDFESYASTAEMAAVWTPAGVPPMELVADRNATPGGAQSSQTPDASASYMYQALDPFVVPTASEPVVFNVNIYDPVGEDPAGTVVNWAELNSVGGPDWFYMHIGMLGWGDTDNIHYDFRANGNGGPNWMDLDEYDAPLRTVGWHTFTVVHKGNFIDVYVDELLSGKNVPLGYETTYARADIGGGYTSAEAVWFDDFCVQTGPVTFGEIGPQAPPPPTVVSPILTGEQTVTVSGVVADAINVTVWESGEPPTAIGTYTGSISTDGIVDVPLVRALVHQERITATQEDPIGASDHSLTLEVGDGHGPLRLGIGIRETGDAGALGSPGTGVGDIEWINVTTDGLGDPVGVPLAPTDSWQTIVFDPANGVTGFTGGGGDGEITEARGTLEHLAIWVDSAAADRSSGVYRLYVDNVINVGADGGSDFVITDFEGYDLGSEVLFQEPGYSGSSAGNLSYPPGASVTSDNYASGGSQSQLLTWFFRDTDAGRWIRDTSASVANVPSPIIDLTKPIQMDLLLVEDCSDKGDMDGDGDVELDDFAAFEGCYEGPANPATLGCVCADFNNDGRVDLADYAYFQRSFAPAP